MEGSFELLKEVFGLLVSAYKFGPLSLIGTSVLVSLRLFKHFAPGYWAKLPKRAKLLLPFGVAFVGTLLLGLASTSLLPALGAALAAGAAAIAAHHGSKAAGAALEPKLLVPVNSLREKGLAILLDIKAAPPPNIVKFPER